MVTNTNAVRPKAYSYIRMSTDLQKKGDSLRRQRELSAAYAERHGLELVEDPMEDIGLSGFDGTNLEYGKLGTFLLAVREGRIPKGSYLIVESLDRISRLEPLDALKPFSDIIKAGIILVTVKPEQKFAAPVDPMQLLVAVTTMIRAHEESSLKSSRLRETWQNKRNNLHEKKATALCPGWLRLAHDRKTFEVIPEHAAAVRQIYDLARAGMGTVNIIRRLNNDGVRTFSGKGSWQASTLNRILNSPAVIGHYQPHKLEGKNRVYAGEQQKNYFPAVIDEDAYYAVQNIRIRRPNNGAGRRGMLYTNLFSKLAVCGGCGEPAWFENRGSRKKPIKRLMCSSAYRGLRGQKQCKHPVRWDYLHFETAFLTFVQQLDLASIVSSEQYNAERNEMTNKLDTIAGRIDLQQIELERVYKTTMAQTDFKSEFLATRLAELEKSLGSAKQERRELEVKLAELNERALHYYEKPDEIRNLIEAIRSGEGQDLFKVRSTIGTRLQGLIEKLILNQGNPSDFEVHFRDGGFLHVCPAADDSTKFSLMSRIDGGEFVVVDPEGEVDRFPLSDAALEVSNPGQALSE